MQLCRLAISREARRSCATGVDLLDCLKAPQIATTAELLDCEPPPDRLSIHCRRSRQCDPIENFADKKVNLNGGQVFAYDLVVEPQTKQASRVAWGFKLNDNPLD